MRLNGFIHTDDKLALKEIWRQLGKEMEVEDELVSKVRRPSLQARLVPDRLGSPLMRMMHSRITMLIYSLRSWHFSRTLRRFPRHSRA